MFRKGGSANSGIMDGLNRKGYVDGTNWEDIAAAYGATGMGDRDDMFKFDWSTMAEPPMGTGDEGSDWLPKWYEKQDPLYKEYKTYLEGEGGIAPGEKGGQGYVGPEKIITGNGKDNGIGDGRGKERGDLDDISVSDLNKKYLKMMAPGMQKRMINDALAAASAAFGESTGDTKQDIANAISAAAAGMGGTKDIYDKVSMLTLSGEIQKDIEAAKGRKLTNFEAAVSMWKDVKDSEGRQKYTHEEALEKASGQQTESARFYEIQEKFGKGEAIADQHKDNPQFWGSYSKMDKKELKKLPDDAIGKYIYDETENSFYTISVNDKGEKEIKFLSRA